MSLLKRLMTSRKQKDDRAKYAPPNPARRSLPSNDRYMDEPPKSALNNLPHDDFPAADIKRLVMNRILKEYQPESPPADSGRAFFEMIFNEVVDQENVVFSPADRSRVLREIIAELIGFGPLEPLLDDPEITEIIAAGYQHVYIMLHGKLEPAPIRFDDENHLRRIVERIVSPMGILLDTRNPSATARLPNGWLINAAVPPLSGDGAVLVIHKSTE